MAARWTVSASQDQEIACESRFPMAVARVAAAVVVTETVTATGDHVTTIVVATAMTIVEVVVVVAAVTEEAEMAVIAVGRALEAKSGSQATGTAKAAAS